MDESSALPAPRRHPREGVLFGILLALAVPAWIALTLATHGLVWLWVLLFIVIRLFVQSALVGQLQGNAVEVNHEQYPDLHARYAVCCAKLGIAHPPRLYVRNAAGAFESWATRFLRSDFVVLDSALVDAVPVDSAALDFWMGHELAHVRLRHFLWDWVLLPVAWLPLVGTAYRRAQEHSCDLHGSACCDDEQAVSGAFALIAVGPARFHTLDRRVWLHQLQTYRGFWMSFHEITHDNAWLTRRLARVLRARGLDAAEPPERHPLAWVLAVFVPRLGLARGLGNLVLVFALLGVIGAVAIPAWQEHMNKTRAEKSRADFESGIRALQELEPADIDGSVPYEDESAAWPPEGDPEEIPTAENWLELYEKLVDINASPGTQEAARQKFFRMHVAPTLDSGLDIDAAYDNFARDYTLPAEDALAPPPPAIGN